MQIYMRGYAGDTGAARLFLENKDKIKEHFSLAFFRKLESFAEDTLANELINEDAIKECGVSSCGLEGGVYEALWKLGEKASCGMTIMHELIPVKQEIIEICEIAEADPYRIDCKVTLYIGEQCREGYKRIGETTDSNDKVVVMKDTIRYIDSRY